MTNSPGLRERKRLTTLRRIYGEAMNLVEKRGFDAVTVEDICAAADISRRTFFNYVDSKDEAILGAFPFELDEGALETIELTPSGNLVELIFSQLTEKEGSQDHECLERRRALMSGNPALAHAAHKRRVETLTALARAVEKHLARFPEDRKLPDVPAEVEVHSVVEMCRTALSLYLASPHFPTGDKTPIECVRAAAHIHTDFCKELAW
ncbi:TetR/AcrR family transcriptional regulator [Corynebacterium qintianiae]|nr:TetR/AcrR family transcriptional regulator [Corynebacterium qintianiae]